MSRLTSRTGAPLHPRFRVPPFGPAPHLCYLYRELLDVTQAEAAKRVGVSLRAWQYYEAGERRPPRRVLDWLARILNRET